MVPPELFAPRLAGFPKLLPLSKMLLQLFDVLLTMLFVVTAEASKRHG